MEVVSWPGRVQIFNLVWQFELDCWPWAGPPGRERERVGHPGIAFRIGGFATHVDRSLYFIGLALSELLFLAEGDKWELQSCK